MPDSLINDINELDPFKVGYLTNSSTRYLINFDGKSFYIIDDLTYTLKKIEIPLFSKVLFFAKEKIKKKDPTVISGMNYTLYNPSEKDLNIIMLLNSHVRTFIYHANLKSMKAECFHQLHKVRLHVGMITIYDHLILVGGCIHTDKIFNKETIALNMQTRDIFKLPELNSGRRGHSMVFVNEHLYVVGGYQSEKYEGCLNIEALYLTTNSLKQKNFSNWMVLSLQLPMDLHECCLIANPENYQFYILGGVTEHRSFSSKLFVFDCNSESIKEINSSFEGGTFNSSFSGAMVGSKLICVDTYKGNKQPDVIHEFDIQDNKWSLLKLKDY